MPYAMILEFSVGRKFDPVLAVYLRPFADELNFLSVATGQTGA
jgi:hypothetical protein